MSDPLRFATGEDRLAEHEPCQHGAWTFRAGWSVCLMCDLKVADGRGLPRGHFGINGEAMDARRVENHFNCPECGQQIRLKWGDGPDRLECMDGHDISALGYAVPRKKAEAAIWRRQQLQEAGVNLYKTKLFPYIDGDRLVGREVTVTIKNVVIEKVGSERGETDEFVLYFKETEKGLILNKTNASVLIDKWGEETDAFKGKRVILYSEFGRWFGKEHNAVRLKVPGNGNSKPVKSPEPPPPPESEDYEAASAEADQQAQLDMYGL